MWVTAGSTEDLRVKGEAIKQVKIMTISQLQELRQLAMMDIVDVTRRLAGDLENIKGADAFFLGMTLGRLDDIEQELGSRS